MTLSVWEGSPEEACLSNPGREKERRHSRWENNPNSEAGKWRTGLGQGGEVKYPRKEGRKKRIGVSVCGNPEVLA